MNLVAGTKLGPYAIEAPLGAGGMGEVYRARDTRLDRIVAIKVLSPEIAFDPQFRERFQREARTISALDHPHICALYDVGEQAGTAFLVMQYLEGETLADRLHRGALPVDQALRIGVQIADALDKAHRQGIVHRDLKPSNIMLMRASGSRASGSAAKLLDFGLSRKAAPAATSAGLSVMATDQASLTAQGTILGTFQYMAPEQIEGQEADARSDVFAFGVVLYEMLAGRRAFTGKTAASLFGAILKEQPPPLSAVRSLAPPALGHLVRSCLEKDPDERIQTMHDVLLQLRWFADVSSSAAPAIARTRRIRFIGLVAGALGVLGLLSLATGVVPWWKHATEILPVRFTFAPPDKTAFSQVDIPAISPDGRRVLFLGQGADGRSALWLRLLDSVEAHPLPGTEGAYFPSWAPDGLSVAFLVDGNLKTIDLIGGPAQAFAATPQLSSGGVWNQHGDMLAASAAGPILRIPGASGEPKPVTVLDKSRQETQHRWPSFLPDGRHFLYLARSGQAEHNGVFVGSLDSPEVRLLISVDSPAVYANGHLLYVREDMLMAQPLDATGMRVAGEASRVAAPIAAVGQAGGRAFSVSSNGVLVYRTGNSLAARQLRWFDRTGHQAAALGEPGDYSNPALAPDGKRLAIGRRDRGTRTRDLWLFDVERGSATRFTFDPAEDLNPVFSRDGRRILFSSNRKGSMGLYSKASTGVGDEEPVFQGEHATYANDLSPDGRFAVYDTSTASADLWIVPLEGERKPVPFLVRPFNDMQAQISSDGRWIAYSSNESGRQEVYVQDFPKPTGKWQISTEGGLDPKWRADGKELFYVSGRSIMVADLRTDGATFRAGVPRALFEAKLDQRILRNRYVVSPDGQRFLVIGEDEQAASSLITVVVNWLPSKPDQRQK